ncbi:MAG: hypothetical protein SWE60_07350 [Thermodesulfobacteriota bacterium]|nr:hypothetical protein [Thermodesulfobacteriota bacterium]
MKKRSMDRQLCPQEGYSGMDIIEDYRINAFNQKEKTGTHLQTK